MPFAPLRLLPEVSLIDPRTISVPSNYRPPDRVRDYYMAEHLKLQKQQERRLQEDFEFRQAERRSNLIDSIANFAGTSGAARSGGHASASTGLKGYTPYSERVMQEVNDQSAKALRAAVATDDVTQMQEIFGNFRASLLQNPDYQRALEQDRLIEQQLNYYANPENRDDFDPQSVENMLSQVRNNVNPVTGLYEQDGIKMSLREKIIGTDTRRFDINRALTDLSKAYAPKAGAEYGIIDETGTTGVVSYSQQAPREVIERDVDRLLTNPKALRELELRYGTNDIEVLKQTLVGVLADNQGQDIDLTGDEIVDVNRRVTGITNITDPIARELNELKLDYTKQQIRTSRALERQRLSDLTKTKDGKTNTIRSLADPKKREDAIKEIGKRTDQYTYNLGDLAIANESSREEGVTKYNLVGHGENSYFQADQSLGQLKENTETISGTLYTTNRDVYEKAQKQGLVVTDLEKPNAIDGISMFSDADVVYTIKGVTVDVPSNRRDNVVPDTLKYNGGIYTNNFLNIKGDPDRYPTTSKIDYEGGGVEHMVFDKLVQGWSAGYQDIDAKLNNRSAYVDDESTLAEMYKVIATSASDEKIKHIADQLGVSPNITLGELKEVASSAEVYRAIVSIENPQMLRFMDDEGYLRTDAPEKAIDAFESPVVPAPTPATKAPIFDIRNVKKLQEYSKVLKNIP